MYKAIKRKKKRLKEKSERQFDSSSIGDIAFLLLIFFIVTGSFILRQGIFLSLPSKTAGSIKIDQKAFFEVFPQNKNYLYEGRVITRKEFKKLLNSHKKNNKETILIIKMKRDVKYDRLVDALSVAKEVGGIKVSLKNAKRT